MEGGKKGRKKEKSQGRKPRRREAKGGTKEER